MVAPRKSWPVLVAVAAVLAVGPVRSQDAGDTSYSRYSTLHIPFQPDPAARLKQIQLYVSQDQGQTWHPVITVTPEQRYFDYRAPQDGLYWFAVRTVDQDNRASPLTMERARPGLKVYVDTRPPSIRLRELPPRDGEVGVEWDVRDENLDAASLRLEYRLAGGADWIPLAADLPAAGQRHWKPNTNGAVEVRLRARDRADNWGEEKVSVNPGGFTGNVANPGQGSTNLRPPESAVRLVNSKRFGIHYKIEEKGPSGVSAVELWYTRDPAGRNWNKYREEKGNPQPPFLVAVEGEGLYGFTLVVVSGVGLGARPPQVGDQPQIWVEVDLTKPVVKLQRMPEVGRGPEAGRLTVAWTATDKNLGPQPITLAYAESAEGPWKPIASQVENSGRYVWQMPPDVPYKFFVRVEAADRAGNVGTDQTPEAVIVDLAQPKGVIEKVEAVGK